MKELLREHKKLTVIIVFFLIWRVILLGIQYFAPRFITINPQFLEQIPWANFDGGHYLSIADGGYHIYQQAFFPFYPLVIRFVSMTLSISTVFSALLISHLAFMVMVVLFYKVSVMEHIPPVWSLLFLFLFPTSFFFVAVYNESLFLALALGMIYALRKKHWLIAGLLGLFASATRLFGFFLLVFPILEYLSVAKSKRNFRSLLPILLVPCGLAIYMLYLKFSTGDAFAFFHALPAFGVQRGDGTPILLPQVLWRYMKIVITASPWTIQYGVALFEFVVFIFGILLLYIGWRQAVKIQYLLYALFVLIVPSFSGTLSSVPRYFLSAFPLFFILGNMHNRWMKIGLLAVFALGLTVCTALFLSGYFVA